LRERSAGRSGMITSARASENFAKRSACVMRGAGAFVVVMP
jgi:hypothetical protein